MGLHGDAGPRADDRGSPRIPNVRPMARCSCPTRSRTITASPPPPRRSFRAPADGTEGTKDATRDTDGKAARPLYQPPQFPLTLPNARTRNGVGQTVKDLSEDPYSGADVTLTLTAKDEAGNEAKSERPFNMRLPGRLFTKPLARALIEQRAFSRSTPTGIPTSTPRSTR